MIYTVGEIAKQFDVAASTLRYYDKEGLLPFVERSSSGMRMFKDEDLSWLKTIECLKKTGMPIKEIKHFIDCCMDGDSKIDERLSIIESQRDAVIKQMQEMQDMF
ncbi:putative HTH-type transcriptional regulator (plasmid) [Peptoclostridium acidaminophilum DSM 3953]|uniref:Putative HTH-type transcriptional regulator n=1 Tax=Peptoclostridium acidaminophilum DSM 3953 TaxID=1286171 RepID=W8TA22_PEPAC|nr:MerR family transcriptional regulator [Peptoclostridium acidaminophilum]AHM57740.1 putative HTH-type transcriptional regulator [Peptoclostridium acidaminophilum DSM 3953]